MTPLPESLKRSWQMAALSRELRRRPPLARTVAGTPLVLFRDPGGRAAALIDRCPHRNHFLEGRMVEGALQCPLPRLAFRRGRRLRRGARLRPDPRGRRLAGRPLPWRSSNGMARSWFD